MSFYSSGIYKRTSSLRASKQGNLQCKTPKGSSSFSIDLYNLRKHNEKLNLSNIMNTSDVTATMSGPNLNASFNQATLSSTVKSKSKNTCETVTNEIFYLRPTSRQSPGRVNFQKILFPDQKLHNDLQFGQTKQAESGLWDSPRSIIKNERDLASSQEQANQENSDKVKGENDSRRKSLSRMTNYSSSDYGTIKKLKEIIHKLQLKDAIQRQEIVKLKRINEQIYKDSRLLEEKVHSLERIKNSEDLLVNKMPQKHSEKRRNAPEKVGRQERNNNFSDIETKPNNKSESLKHQVEEIALEKLKLEETLKNLLLDRELSKIKAPLLEIEFAEGNSKIKNPLESNNSNSISNPVFQSNIQVSTPLKVSSYNSAAVQPSNQLLIENSNMSKDRNIVQDKDQYLEKKLRTLTNQSSRENSPNGRTAVQASAPNSQRSRRISPIDLIFNSNLESRKDQMLLIVSNRNTPRTNKNNSHRDYNPSPRLERKAKDEQKINNFSVDYKHQQQATAEINSTMQINSDITPIKAVPLGENVDFSEILEKTVIYHGNRCLNKQKEDISLHREKDVNISTLNNVSPAVLDIISQYKHKQINSSSRNSSVSNCYSKDETCSVKLNLEQLFASNIKNVKKEVNTPLAQMTNNENMPHQGLEYFKKDPHILSSQVLDILNHKKEKNITPENKTNKKNPLDELSFAQKFTGCVPINLSSLSQGKINNSFHVPAEIKETSATLGICPIILSAQPQGRVISSKRAQMALETLRVKMNKREAQ